MKVYLAVPIIAHKQLDKAKAMAEAIRGLGHQLVSTWVVGDDPGFSLPTANVFERDLRGVKSSDILVAEVSQGSHGVGMEVMAAYLYGKRIVLLYEEGARVSHMLLGVPNVLLVSYSSLRDMEAKLKSALLEASSRI